MKLINISLDVERDLDSKNFLGIKEGISSFEKIMDKYEIRPTLFVTGEAMERFGHTFKKLKQKGWEISFHSYSHKRFDILSPEEQKKDFKKGIAVFRKFNFKPKGFRAPQHSASKDMFKLLKENSFYYDSSIAPRDTSQLIFFRRIKHWFKQFISKTNPYYKGGVLEIPTSSFFIPFTAFSLRLFPLFLLKILFLIFWKRKIVLFYCHSWDFIRLERSRLYKLCRLKKFIYKLEKLLDFLSKKGKFIKLENLI